MQKPAGLEKCNCIISHLWPEQKLGVLAFDQDKVLHALQFCLFNPDGHIIIP